MKATYHTHNGRITFEVEAESVKPIFVALSQIQEVFDCEHECGMCHSTDLRFQARKVDDFDFYELACNKCRARFSFGQAKKGGALFPKRRDEDGNKLEHGGWSRWEPQGTSAPVPAEPPNGMKRASVPQVINDRISDGTPEGLQPSFDRLGVLFNKPAPTRIGSALDLIRDEMNDLAGNAGTSEFDRIYRAFEAGRPDKTIALTWKALLKDLMTALDAMHLGVR